MVSPRTLATRLKGTNKLKDISERIEYDTNSNNLSVIKDDVDLSQTNLDVNYSSYEKDKFSSNENDAGN